MGLRIVELFGYSPEDGSHVARASRANTACPFLGKQCQKTLSDGTPSGVCTVKLVNSGPVICCPIRLYAGHHRILQDVAVRAFGSSAVVIKPDDLQSVRHDGNKVVAFGKHSGRELQLPRKKGRGGYFVDWVLAKLDSAGELDEFVAVEVQTIDTTGSYRQERDAYLNEKAFPGPSKGGLNWENVSKRILPQIIYKGHVLRREQRCTGGMFFVCPAPVYERINDRLGGNLLEYRRQPGSLTFMWYDVGPEVAAGNRRDLCLQGEFITTVDQVATAFTSPTNLPPSNVYERAIKAQLK